MDNQLDPPPPCPRFKGPVKVKTRDSIFPLATFNNVDAAYLGERIGELHYHAKLHEGELCAKLNRARIGGMIEVLDRMGLAVDCDWDSCTKKVGIFTRGDFEFLKRVREGK